MRHQFGLRILSSFVGYVLPIVTAVTGTPVTYKATTYMETTIAAIETTTTSFFESRTYTELTASSNLPKQVTEIQSPETTSTETATNAPQNTSVTTIQPLPTATTSVGQSSNVSENTGPTDVAEYTDFTTDVNPTQTENTGPTDGKEYTDFTTDVNPTQTEKTGPTDGAEYTDFTTDVNPTQTESTWPTDGAEYTDFTTDVNPTQTESTWPTDGAEYTDFTTDVNPTQTENTGPTDGTEYTDFTTGSTGPTDGKEYTDFTTDVNPTQTENTGPTDGTEYTDFTTGSTGPTDGKEYTDFTTDVNPTQTESTWPTAGTEYTDVTTDVNPTQTESTWPTYGIEYTYFTTDVNPTQTESTWPTDGTEYTYFTTDVNPTQTESTWSTDGTEYTDFTTDVNPTQTENTGPTDGTEYTDFTTDVNPTQTESTWPTDGAEYTDFTTDVNPTQTEIKWPTYGTEYTDFTTDVNPTQTESTWPTDGAEYTDFTTDVNPTQTESTWPTDGTEYTDFTTDVNPTQTNTSGPTEKPESRTKVEICQDDVDWKGGFWAEVLVGQTRRKDCPQRFSGIITRYCQDDGRWSLPKYNCVRESIKTVQRNVDALGPNATEKGVKEVLEEIANATKQQENITQDEILTDGELDVLVDSLEKIVETVRHIPGNILDEEITDYVIETTSNLIDKTNQESWRSLKEAESSSGEKVLSTVDSISGALCPALERSRTDKLTVVKKNLAFEVQKVSNDDMLFPGPDVDGASVTENQGWLKQTKSKIQLDAVSLKSDPCSVAAVMYRDLSDILPVKTSAQNTSINDVTHPKETINGPILAMSITPAISGKLDPPVRITFEHADTSLTKPVCAFWQFLNDSQGYWSTDGCKVIFTNEDYTRCECDHLTNFAVLMSPFSQADATSQALRIISIVGISVSIICLLITFVVHFILWRRVRHDRTTRLMNLCTALLLSYIIFLAGVDRTEITIVCTVIAALLHYIYLVVFAIMLVEGIEITVFVLYVFKTKSRTKLLLIFAWVLPGVIVGISLGVTKANGYGDSNFCWLSVDNGVIWAFVAPALVIIFFNVICIFLVLRALYRSTAVKNKNAADKIKTSLWSLCVLVPVMGISWLLGLFYVNDSFNFIQYIFAIFNGLQGFFIFLFHCLLNEQVRSAYSHRARKKSAAYFSPASLIGKPQLFFEEHIKNNTSTDELNIKTKEKIISSDDGQYDKTEDQKNKIFQETLAESQSGAGTSDRIYCKVLEELQRSIQSRLKN